MLFSCSIDTTENDSIEATGQWSLYKIGGSFTANPSSIRSGANMECQEYFIINVKGTYIKSRERNRNIVEVFRIYVSNTTNSSIQLDLVFNSESEIIGTCVSPVNETLSIPSNNIFEKFLISL
jgi:hypothetical protein